MYSSDDLGGGAYRIPATFTSSAAYGGMLALTAPFLVAAWAKSSRSFLHRRILEAGFLAAGLGVFMSASRTSAIVFAVIIAGVFVSLRTKFTHRLWICVLLVFVGWIVSKDERLQRFMTLRNSEYVTQRIGGSLDSENFLQLLSQYPMGNGLGGGGTSLPYFLRERLVDPVYIENEYGRILGEQGVPGLVLWVAFIFWLIASGWPRRVQDGGHLGRFLLWCALAFSFFGAPLGTGLLTAIPMTPILLISGGWLIGRNREERLLLENSANGQPQPQPVQSLSYECSKLTL
jgi:hypothetical protein